MEGGGTLTKYEIAKDITIALLHTTERLNTGNVESVDEYNEILANNIATFYNKLVEKLNAPE
jgi:hypothetical protein